MALAGVALTSSSTSKPSEEGSWLGGEPLYLSPPDIPDYCCRVCGARLKFVAQVYAPVTSSPRALHVFCCEAHAGTDDGWYVARTQRSPAPEATKPQPKKTNFWDDDDGDDDSDDSSLETMLQSLEDSAKREEEPKPPPKRKERGFRRSEIVWYKAVPKSSLKF